MKLVHAFQFIWYVYWGNFSKIKLEFHWNSILPMGLWERCQNKSINMDIIKLNSKMQMLRFASGICPVLLYWGRHGEGGEMDVHSCHTIHPVRAFFLHSFMEQLCILNLKTNYVYFNNCEGGWKFYSSYSEEKCQILKVANGLHQLFKAIRNGEK